MKVLSALGSSDCQAEPPNTTSSISGLQHQPLSSEDGAATSEQQPQLHFCDENHQTEAVIYKERAHSYPRSVPRYPALAQTRKCPEHGEQRWSLKGLFELSEKTRQVW